MPLLPDEAMALWRLLNFDARGQPDHQSAENDYDTCKNPCSRNCVWIVGYRFENDANNAVNDPKNTQYDSQPCFYPPCSRYRQPGLPDKSDKNNHQAQKYNDSSIREIGGEAFTTSNKPKNSKQDDKATGDNPDNREYSADNVEKCVP